MLWSVCGPESWPIGGSAEHFDFNADGKTDARDAAALAFREDLFEGRALGFLVIAAYQDGRMTSCAVLDGSGELGDRQIALLRAAGEIRLFFLSEDYQPLAPSVKADRP